MKKSSVRTICIFIALVVVVLGIIIKKYSDDKKDIVTNSDVNSEFNNGISKHGGLSVTNGALVDDEGEIFQLKGFSTHGLTWYPRYTNANAMATLKEYGANVFRLAVYSEVYVSDESSKKKTMDYTYLAIENALYSDMYIIVDWHILNDNNPLKYMEEAKGFFEEISSHYGDNYGIIYEICNEPNGDTSWSDIVQYANEIIPIIRNNAPSSVIIVGTPAYSSRVSDVLESPLSYDNIMYAYHEYLDISVDEEYDSYYLDKVKESGIPIFITEWGIVDNSEDNNNDGEELYSKTAETFLEYLDDNKISWCNWSLSNKDEIHSVIKSDCDKYSGWEEEDFTFIGNIVIRALRK
jgi:endoglucanase